MLGIAAFIVSVMILIVIHEYGHYLAARVCGIKIKRFSIGFGKILWQGANSHGTVFTVCAIPLGGFVQMLDTREGVVALHEQSRAFDKQTALVRFLVLLAGPACNVLLAFLLYWGLFSVGITYVKPIIGDVKANSIAAQAHLQSGEQVLQIDDHPVINWRDAVMALMLHLGNADQAHVRTDKGQYQLSLAHWRLDPIQPKVLQSLGIKPKEPTLPVILSQILPNSPAQQAGLLPGDEITAIGVRAVNNWQPFKDFVTAHPGLQTNVTVKRQGETQIKPIQLTAYPDWLGRARGQIGIEVQTQWRWPESLQQAYQLSLWQACAHAASVLGYFALFNCVMIGKMLLAVLSLQSLVGPFGLYQAAEVSAMMGLAPYIDFLALLSFAVGFVNLLPLPGLDGGHILLLAIEKIRGRALSLAWQVLLFRLGMILLGVLMTIAFANDLMRLSIELMK